MFENVYVFCVKSNLHSLSYKEHLIFDKYVNALFYFDIFDLILNMNIYSNHRMMFEFIKNVNKRFYIHFDAYKNEIFNVFKSFKINVKYNNFIIKRIYNNENIVIKN